MEAHKPDCPCPACAYRRRGQGERTPMRSMRLPEDVWAWLCSRPQRTAGYVVDHVRTQMHSAHAEDTHRAGAGRGGEQWDVARLGPCCHALRQALEKEEVVTVVSAPIKSGRAAGLYVIPGPGRASRAKGVWVPFCPFCGADVRPSEESAN